MTVSESSVYAAWETLPETAKAVVVTVIANIITQGAIFSNSIGNMFSVPTQEIQIVVGLFGVLLVIDGVHKSRIHGIHGQINHLINLIEDLQNKVSDIVRPDGGKIINQKGSFNGLFGGALLGTALGVSSPIYIPLITGFIGALAGNRLVRITGLQAQHVGLEKSPEWSEVESESEDNNADVSGIGERYLYQPNSGIGERYLYQPNNITLRIMSLIESALISAQREDYKTARQNLSEGLDIVREVGSDTDQASILELVGDMYLRSGDLKSAQKYFQNSLNIYQYTGYMRGEITLRLKMARVAREQGQLENAEDHLLRAKSLIEQSRK